MADVLGELADPDWGVSGLEESPALVFARTAVEHHPVVPHCMVGTGHLVAFDHGNGNSL